MHAIILRKCMDRSRENCCHVFLSQHSIKLLLSINFRIVFCPPFGIYNIHQRQMNSRFSLQCIWFLFVLSRRSNSSKPETLCANILETAFARGKDENNSVCSLIILQFFELPDIFSCSRLNMSQWLLICVMGEYFEEKKIEIEIASYCGQCKSLPHACQMKWLTNVRDFYEINIWWPKTVNNLRNIKDHYTAHKKFSSTKIELCYFEKWSVYFVFSDLS